MILEAGINLEKVKKALDFNISSIVGCCVTHEHGDHAKYVLQYLNARIPIRMSPFTLKWCNTAIIKSPTSASMN